MTETVKAAIYTRVSTEEQAQPDKTSLAQQRERAEAFCKAHGWQVVQVYEDAGVSGAKSSRPALNIMLADAGEGKFQRVVFLKLDRRGRNLRDLLNISHRLNEIRVGIVSIHDSFDTGTSSGRLFFSILGAATTTIAKPSVWWSTTPRPPWCAASTACTSTMGCLTRR